MSTAATSPDFIKFVVETYRHDFTGYRLDILGRKPNPATLEMEQSLVDNKRTAAGTGHGIGKTALGADAIHWFIATRPHPAIVATANTESQLKTKLWRELAKTNAQAKNRDWFDWKTNSFTMFADPTARAEAIAWSADNPEAFAGTHEKHVLGVFDEASAIDRVIFNVWQGAMTTEGARTLMLGNSTRTEGYFYDAVHGVMKARQPGDLLRGRWNSFIIPSTASPFVDPSWVQDMKEQFGEESDEYRVRVLGLPPRQDSEQFIPREWVDKAMSRQVQLFSRWPLILGCDVGRGDRSVMLARRGNKVLPKIEVLQGERTMDFARRIASEVRFYREEYGLTAQVILEELGIGVGVVESLQDMGFADQVWGVNTGNAADDRDLYTNGRCEMWGRLREWLEGAVELPNHKDLMEDLTVLKRKPSASGKLRLETKDEMRRRGVKSPDVGDALALTFAIPFDLLPEHRRDRDRWDGDYQSAQTPGASDWMAF